MFGFDKIFSSRQIRDADTFTIAHEPILSIDLMERAAISCYKQLEADFGIKKRIAVICGQGNNGGDGFAIARLLAEKGNQKLVDTYTLLFSDKTSDDCNTNRQRLISVQNVRNFVVTDASKFELAEEYDVVIDAIFGTGLSKKVTGKWAKIISKINELQHITVVAVDLPSGLYSDIHTPVDFPVVEADFTYSFQFPKLAFMFAENARAVGDFKILPIGLSHEYISQTQTNYFYIKEEGISSFRKKREKFSHKGNYGHALIIAGSYGKIGAAVLASEACLHSGVGLLTTHLPAKGVDILQTALPEAMASIDICDEKFSALPSVLNIFTTIGIGPGIGISANTQKAFFNLLNHYQKPLVVDADALNILSKNKDWLKLLPAGSIITPHVKEFERLTKPVANDFERLELQSAFAREYNIIVVLKGAHTSICSPEGDVYFNSTGNPGMATAGSGDVLTGIITAYLAQGYSSIEAAVLGVFDHGKAGDKAKSIKGEQAMIASDIINHL